MRKLDAIGRRRRVFDKLSDEQIAQAVALRKGGVKLAAIAIKLSASIRTVNKLMQVTGTRLPADRFWCGHPKSADNLARKSGGRLRCRVCQNARRVARYYQQTGRSPVRLERSWQPSSSPIGVAQDVPRQKRAPDDSGAVRYRRYRLKNHARILAREALRRQLNRERIRAQAAAFRERERKRKAALKRRVEDLRAFIAQLLERGITASRQPYQRIAV